MSEKIFVAGHRGMVGSAIVRSLQAQGQGPLVLRSRKELDLREQSSVEAFFKQEQPTQVYLAAARVGGILANSVEPAQFLRDNLAIQTNVIHAAATNGAKKLLFLGSSCIYPKMSPQPIREESLLTGPLEPTNEWYAIAKIAGIKMCQAYRKQYGFDAIALMPTNLYGPGDNYDLERSHVLPAMIRKFHDAKMAGNAPVTLWGTGTPRREFLHVDDLAAACTFLMKSYSSPEILNVGIGEDYTIRELAELVQRTVGHQGEIRWDTTKPDGTPRKLLDISRSKSFGWRAGIQLEKGLQTTYRAFIESSGQSAKAPISLA